MSSAGLPVSSVTILFNPSSSISRKFLQNRRPCARFWITDLMKVGLFHFKIKYRADILKHTED